MLSNCKVTAIAPAVDLERARRFYAEQLGLTPTDENPGGITYRLGEGTELFLYQSEYAGRAGHTIAGFTVADVPAEVAELKSRGVTFERYDLPEMTWDGDVASHPQMGRVAWFTDSEGNIFALDDRPS